MSVRTYKKEIPEIIKESNREENISDSEKRGANNSRNKEKNKTKMEKKKGIIIIIVSIIIVLIIGLSIASFFIIKNTSKTVYKDNYHPKEIPKAPVIAVLEPLKQEFKINTKINDLRRIKVEQKYKEEILEDGVLNENFVYRITNYDLLFFAEKKSEKYEELYFNKTYTGSIAIASECLSTESENCEPKKFLDLNDQNYGDRNLEETNDLKDFPIPFCLFNITDNDVITSIACPESLPKSKIDTIVLDLYFMKPPSIERPNKGKGNIKINIKKEGDKQYIRDTDVGICSIQTNKLSNCTTDFNLTTDLEGNVLSYDELCFSKITTDIKNYYIKNKITKLVDETNNFNDLNAEKYNETLNQLLPEMIPYMKYEERFTFEEFKKLYNTCKNKTEENEKRSLEKYEGSMIEDQIDIFNYEHITGVKFSINLKDIPGYKSNKMETLTNYKTGDSNFNLIHLKEDTNFDNILNKLLILNKAGNNKANILYENIGNDFNNITDIITLNISSLNNLVLYQDLLKLFDSSLSLGNLTKLTIKAVEYSDYLKNKLDDILNSNDNNLRQYLDNLSNSIRNYITKSMNLVEKVSDNLNDLRKSLNSKKSPLTEIATYYLNYTTNSYTDTILEAQKVLTNYFQNQKDLITPKVEDIIKKFENFVLKSTESQTNKINKILPKIEDGSIIIESASQQDYQKIISNLKNSNNYLFNIINQIKQKIKKAMNLKDNGYFISSNEINLNFDIYNSTIENALIMSKKLDDDEYIDKIFDEIMIHFRDNFSDNEKFMDNIKIMEFTLNENILKNSHFSDLKSISSQLTEIGVNIYEKINEENERYLKLMENKLNQFLNTNKNYLIDLINKLNTLFSEEDLNKLSNLYNIGFENSLNKIEDDINTNYNLTEEYLSNISGVIQDSKKIAQILHEYKNSTLIFKEYKDEYKDWWNDENHYVRLVNHTEDIQSKKITRKYLNIYKTFKKSSETSKEYINNAFYSDLLKEYKNPIIKLKGLLQIIKNTKITNLYPNLDDLKFTDENIQKIDILYYRLNNIISDNNFNNKYVKKIKDFKQKQNIKIENLRTFIQNQNQIINTKDIENNLESDFCYSFFTKAFYSCTNGEINYYKDSSDFYCLNVTQKISNNYNNLKTISIYNYDNFQNFINKFNEFYKNISNIVNSYNAKIMELRNSLSSVKKEVIKENITLNYLLPIQNNIINLLSQKYGDKLINASYEYYKTDTKNRMKTIMDNITEKWVNVYDSMNKEIIEKKDKIKSGSFELGLMAQISNALITSNISNSFYESLIIHQKTEFNYTISYYYNYLLKSIKSVQKYILNKIPINKSGFNDIINIRKNEVNTIFNQLIQLINNSKINSLLIKNQIKSLNLSEEDFFNTNDILYNNIQKTKSCLAEKIQKPFSIITGINKYSFTNRFYLENSQIGKQIKKFYSEIEEKVFVNLKLDAFIELIKENYIFDKNEFINRIELSLMSSSNQIQNLFNTEKKKYKSELETNFNYFNQDDMINYINELYNKEIKYLSNSQINSINNYITEALSIIKNYISSEAKNLEETLTSYTNNYLKIQNTLNQYKKILFNNLNTTVSSAIEEFHKSITNKILDNYIDKAIKYFKGNATLYTQNFTEYKTLNDSYNIKEIIMKIIDDISFDYRDLTKKQIDKKYEFFVEKIKIDINLNQIEKTINNEIENEYKSKLLPALKKYAIYNPGDSDYIEFDFNKNIKDNINSIINTKIKSIQDIIDTTKAINFEIKYHEYNLDFERENEYSKIYESFKQFINPLINDEENNFKNLMNQTIKSNLIDALNDIIQSFGNDFFDRIIKYNENFKITGLYNNLKHSIFLTISYYLLVNQFEEIEELPRDLKLKLYNLNNLDLIAKEKNKKIMELFHNNIKEFITNSKQSIVSLYYNYINEYIIKENYFSYNDKINQIIKEIIIDLRNGNTNFDNEYTSLLNQQFEQKFITSYTKTMNEQTNEMIKIINNQKELLKAEIDHCFTLDPEEVLNDINTKLNKTLDSINEYNNFNEFNISEDFSNYLYDYGNVIISPSYKKLIDLIDESSKNITLKNIEKNCKEYEDKLNSNKFINLSNEIYLLTKEIFDKIKRNINSYGINDYRDNLENEIEQIEENRRRRLSGEKIEEKSFNKALAEIFRKLKSYSEDTNEYINSYEEFNNFKTNISDNINNLKISFKKSQELIEKNNYEQSEYNFLIEKLNYMNNISLLYFDKVNNSFYNLNNYLNNSINEINDLIIQSENMTYNIFSEKYENISLEAETFEKEQNIIENEEETINSTTAWENKNLNSEAKIGKKIKKASFKYSVDFKNGNSPKLNNLIATESRPETITLKIYEGFGNCGEGGEILTIRFNNVSHITNFTADLEEITLKTITNIESYEVEKKKYKISNSNQQICRVIMGVKLCAGDSNSCQEQQIIGHFYETHKKVNNSKTIKFSIN